MDGDSPEEKAGREGREKARLRQAYEALQRDPHGKVRDATILAASRMQAQVAALRSVQRERAEKFQVMQATLKEGINLNAMELARTLTELKGAENDLDVLVLHKLEMEAVWAHLGSLLFDMSEKRGHELTTASAFEDLLREKKP
jgi:hypothetical protein